AIHHQIMLAWASQSISSPPASPSPAASRSHKSLEIFSLGDDGEAVGADGQAARKVELAVPADLKTGRDFHFLVDDAAADSGMAADVHAVQQDRVLHQGVAVDPHIRRDDAAEDLASRDDGSLA